MKNKVVPAAVAAAKIPDGAFVAYTGVGGSGVPAEAISAIAERFEKEQHPREISVIHAGGNQMTRALAKEGLMGAYYSGITAIPNDLIDKNLFPVYSLSQGICVQMYRAQANDSPFLTRAGVNTFLDPRIEAGAANQKAEAKPIVKVVTIDGEEFLHYTIPPITVAIIRGTSADPDGNITTEEEAVKYEMLYLAMAARANGGIVIAQVRQIAKPGTIAGADVKVPGFLVDYVIPCSDPDKLHMPPLNRPFSRALTGQQKVDDAFIPIEGFKPDGERLIVARRACLELRPDYVCNVGIGMPVGMSYVVSTEGIHDRFYLSNEMGAIGGHIGGGMFFGLSFNAVAYMQHHEMFDFINGHGLDITFLGAAEIGEDGSVNVTRIGGNMRGSGGFVNIAANTRKVVFLSSFTVGGSSTGENGALKIVEPGTKGKFLPQVDQISFNGKDAAKRGQEIMYITERAVFQLIDGKVTLTEYAEGLDIQKDILDFMDFKPEIASDLKTMSPHCFTDGLIGLKQQWENM